MDEYRGSEATPPFRKFWYSSLIIDKHGMTVQSREITTTPQRRDNVSSLSSQALRHLRRSTWWNVTIILPILSIYYYLGLYSRFPESSSNKAIVCSPRLSKAKEPSSWCSNLNFNSIPLKCQENGLLLSINTYTYPPEADYGIHWEASYCGLASALKSRIH